MTTRRAFLRASALGLSGAIANRAIGQTTLLAEAGRKFSLAGRVLPFAGNTIICHVPQQGEHSEAFDALLDIFRAMPGESWMRKVAALPPSSYHMTVFGGADDKDRRYPLWPADMPLDLPMATCNEILARRLRAFRLGPDVPPYRMRVDTGDPSSAEAPLTIRLKSADQDTEGRLRRLRDRLSVATGIRDPGHDRFHFHVTLGYQVAELSTQEAEDFRTTLTRWKSDIAARAPVIELGAPEFCLLADMFAFKRQFYLK